MFNITPEEATKEVYLLESFLLPRGQYANMESELRIRSSIFVHTIACHILDSVLSDGTIVDETGDSND